MAQFQVVQDEVTANTPDTAVAQRMLMIALSALSQRAIAGISALFSLVGLASVWALWWHVLADPNVYQIGGIFLYSIFLLSLEIIRRRK